MSEDRLYFRQLLAGRDFAAADEIARQMVNFVYLVGDRETGEALIVDPAYGVRELVEIAGADGLRVVGALVTHYHPDHVGGSLMGWEIEGVAALLGLEGVDAPIHVNRAEARGVQRVTGASESDLVLHDGGDVVTVGEIPITLVHTPGHTPGSQCFLVDGRLVAGDTLFLDGCGRTDLRAAMPTRCMRASRSGSQQFPTARCSTRDINTPPSRSRPWARRGRATTCSACPRSSSGAPCSEPELRMELRDGDSATEPGRTLAYELWCEMEQLYADDPTAPEAKGENHDLRHGELAPPSGRFIIMFDDRDRPVACGAIRRHDDESAEIKRMYVRPEARGCGISRVILRELEATAIDFGYRALILETGLRQPEAIALYESHGYTRIPNFGYYRDSLLSVCCRKELDAYEV